MVNSAGVYLELDGQQILLCDEKWGLVPIGVGLADFESLPEKLGVCLGESVSCGPNGLQFPKGWIKIEPIPSSAQKVASVAEAAIQMGRMALLGRTKGLAPLAETLLNGKPAPENNPLCALALPRLDKLLAGIRDGERASVEEAVKMLLGLGPGLTPSADDVLCGMLYGLRRSVLARDAVLETLADTVCREAKNRTHPVSAAYLQAMAEGEEFQRLEEAWLTLTGRGTEKFDRILEVGSSSGGDLLLGLLLAGKLCLEREEKADGRTDSTDIVG